MSVEIIWTCGRCRNQLQRIEREEVLRLPLGWQTVEGQDLCDNCVLELHRFLNGAELLDAESASLEEKEFRPR